MTIEILVSVGFTASVRVAAEQKAVTTSEISLSKDDKESEEFDIIDGLIC